MSACQCKAQIRPRPVIFVCVFLVLSKKYSKFRRRKKMWHCGLEEFILKKSKLTKRKCDMVSIQYVSMLHVRVELMNGLTHEVYKPTILIFMYVAVCM